MQTFARLVAWSSTCIDGLTRVSVFDDLLTRIKTLSGIMMQSNYMQDLFVWFTRFQLVPMRLFDADIADILKSTHCTRDSPGLRLLGSGASTVVRVTLLVPKAAMERLRGNPVLEMGLNDVNTFDNKYQSAHVTFVRERIRRSDTHWTACCSHADIIMNNFSLVSGGTTDYSFVAFSFFAPLCALAVVPPSDVNVCLGFHRYLLNFATMRALTAEYGPDLTAFSAKLNDADHVSWSFEPHHQHPRSYIARDVILRSASLQTLAGTADAGAAGGTKKKKPQARKSANLRTFVKANINDSSNLRSFVNMFNS